ncbi:MAG: glycerol-3-phosphate acyltransferase [Anaerolineales bacterium]
MGAALFLFGFVCGSLPFSAWLARWLTGTELRRVGDGNPGAANAWKAGGWRVGLLALLLDFVKGAAPVALAQFVFHLAGPALGMVALAPILGHAFSPFLKFRGGKGLTVTFGAWAGLTLAEGPVVLGLFMTVMYFVVEGEAWAVLFSLAGLLAHLLLQGAAPALVAAWLGNALIIAWTHRQGLRRLPRLRPVFSARRARAARSRHGPP